ncbi:hypothetical protein KP509_24G009000 [Ceratopteris richardii]|uniref:Uncharacterized protein n=1 Tax=Ceratopteris richardii TaxID=49495 RepID=A0A8T2RV65_CERRI|nr:hypothetical protein KP509_24G009000 [Ceratopteris richardii]
MSCMWRIFLILLLNSPCHLRLLRFVFAGRVLASQALSCIDLDVIG